MLKLIKDAGHELYYVVNKPRTHLDQKQVTSKADLFPFGSVEQEVWLAISTAQSIYPFQRFSFKQISSKRGWWVDGYLKALDYLPNDLSDFIVYTNTPFSWKLIRGLKQRGAKILFDSMDNMVTYPHFWKIEKKAAKIGYREALFLADFASANSQRTVDYFFSEFGKCVNLIKNGVFKVKAIRGGIVKEVNLIKRDVKQYNTAVGFVGKFGLRINHDLIDRIAKLMPNVLFALIGPDLEGLCDELYNVISKHPNVVKYPPVPSSYLYEVLSLFDCLMIPYSVGKNENSGDPLKLYQYFLAGKPILCTPVKEVDEYSDYIKISDSASEWHRYIDALPLPDYKKIIPSILWEARAEPLIAYLNGLDE